MIALQEEMDWLVYAAYGLIPMDHPGVGQAFLPDSPLSSPDVGQECPTYSLTRLSLFAG
jgi:hypothetical protein